MRLIFIKAKTKLSNKIEKAALPSINIPYVIKLYENIRIVYVHLVIIPCKFFLIDMLSFYIFIPQLKSFNIEIWDNQAVLQLHNTAHPNSANI